MPAGLPDYDKPPVTEVGLSVTFSSVPTLTTAQLARFWQEHLGDFPRTEDQGYFQSPQELFGPARLLATFPPIQFGAPPPRMWALNTEGTSVVQLQRDWIGLNWRRLDTVQPGGAPSPYPTYKVLGPQFIALYERFGAWVEKSGLGAVIPTQCEVTYVNHILIEEPLRDHGDFSSLLSFWSDRWPVGFLPHPEDGRLDCNWVMAAGRARLHLSLQPAVRVTDGRAMFALTLTARGAPETQDLTGVRQLLDDGHEWIVRGFQDVIHPELRKLWGEHER
jgi:uncharacterized protein (TIGR04255 family)